jgi:formamidopyrimidine-DNA glycosylase
MPETVELRTDADILDFYICNRQLLNLEINDIFKNKCTGYEDIKAFLPLKITKVLSKAKKLFIKLENNWWIIMTYGMTGSMSLDKGKHSHITFQLEDHYIGYNIFFYNDPRRIGSFIATNDTTIFEYHATDMAKQIVLGYKFPFFESIKLEEFSENIQKGKKKSLAKLLMDQRSICSGIGNYLLSEIFYEARLHPDIKCNELSVEKIEELFIACSTVINNSYENHGMSMSDYINADGVKGEFQNKLKVYGKEGQLIEGKIIKMKKGSHGRNIWYVDF